MKDSEGLNLSLVASISFHSSQLSQLNWHNLISILPPCTKRARA